MIDEEDARPRGLQPGSAPDIELDARGPRAELAPDGDGPVHGPAPVPGHYESRQPGGETWQDRRQGQERARQAARELLQDRGIYLGGFTVEDDLQDDAFEFYSKIDPAKARIAD